MRRKRYRQLRRTLLLGFFMLLCLYAITLCYMAATVKHDRFFRSTQLNDFDISERTVEETVEVLKNEYETRRITVTEHGETMAEYQLSELGYTVDEAALRQAVSEVLRNQNQKVLSSRINGNDFQIALPVYFDEELWKKTVSKENLRIPRTKTRDAQLSFDGSIYDIEPEVYGNDFDEEAYRKVVKENAQKLADSMQMEKELSVELPDTLYELPQVTADDPDLNTRMNAYNAYCNANITLQFGDQREVLDWSVIQSWIEITDGEGVLSEEKVWEYVYTLAEKYDTLYRSKSFLTNQGEEVTFEISDYGYKIDQDAEVWQLTQDIKNNAPVNREPVYAVRGYSRSGREDILDSYVEIDLTRQHLWFYMNGELIIESDFVSGTPTKERETITGIFPLAYKDHEAVLTGGNGIGAYATEVSYWMPFYDGQGLHDAWWRDSFGGTIYQTDGSHGCINLPTEAAEIIFEHIEENVPIILYK